MALIEVHSGPDYPFKLHLCTLPARTKVTYVSEDYMTITVTADEDTCFGPDTPRITITAQYPLGETQTVSGVLSADRKSFTFSSFNNKPIESFNVIQGWTYDLGLETGYNAHGRFKMSYNTDLETYEPVFIADWGYKVDTDGVSYYKLYNEFDDQVAAVTVSGDIYQSDRVYGWKYDIEGVWPDSWAAKKKYRFMVRTVTNGDTVPAVVNNTNHTSYVLRAYYDDVNEYWYPILEVNFDQFWYPRSTFQILVNNVAQTIEVDGDFYYTRRCKALMVITSFRNTITIDGDVYHREWPYVENPEAQPDEDKVIYTCTPGYRIAYEYIDGAYHDMLWIPVNNVKHWFTVNETKTSGVLDLAFYVATNDTVWLNARTVHGQFDRIPTGDVSMAYNLSHCSVQGTAPSTLALDGHLQLTLVADNGYQFNTPPTLRYYDDWDNAVNVSAVVSQDKLTATFDWYPFSANLSADYPNHANFLISGTAALAPVAFDATVVNAISGTTYDVVGTTINVYAPNGYHFTAAPTLHWHESEWDDEGDANFTMAADGKSASISAYNWRTSIYTLTINGAIEEDHQWAPGTITVPQHTTYSVTGTTLTVTCDTGYQFASAPTIAQVGTAGPITMTLNGASNVATANIEDYDGLAVTVTGTVEATPTPVETYQVYTQLTNCTGTGIPGSAAANDTLNITLTCDAGYIFDPNDIPSLDYIKNDNLTYHVYFTIGTDTATLSLNLSTLEIKSGSALTVYGEGVYNDTPTPPDPPTPGPSIEDKYGMVNIYHVSSSELATFASRRFQYDQSMNVFDDWGNYVTSLRRVFVTIASETVSAIKCGRYNTNISSHTPTTDTVTLNFGNVTIPAHNLDITDYSSKVQIFLPFIGFRDISAEYAGKTLSLTYEINIVTGEGVAKLTCNSNVVYLYECAPSSDMAYKTNTMVSQTLGGSNFNTKYMYGLVPYVLVKWYSNRNKHLVNNDCVRCTIGDFQGYAKFNEVTDINNNQITAEEKNLLLRTLAGGVYIEDEQD